MRQILKPIFSIFLVLSLVLGISVSISQSSIASELDSTSDTEISTDSTKQEEETFDSDSSSDPLFNTSDQEITETTKNDATDTAPDTVPKQESDYIQSTSDPTFNTSDQQKPDPPKVSVYIDILWNGVRTNVNHHIYYVTAYSDSACTKIVKTQPVEVRNSNRSSIALFDNLSKGKYWFAESDSNGNLKKDTDVLTISYPKGYTTEIINDGDWRFIAIQNNYSVDPNEFNEKEDTLKNTKARITIEVLWNGVFAQVNNATYYVTVYTDPACTKIVSTKSVALKNASSAAVIFDNLPTGIYYIGESNSSGILKTDTFSLRISYPYGNTFYVTEDNATKDLKIQNNYISDPKPDLPTPPNDARNTIARVTIETLWNGKSALVNNKLYFVTVYADAACTKAVQTKSVAIKNASSATILFNNTPLGTYYIAESDSNGKLKTDTVNLKISYPYGNTFYVAKDNATKDLKILNNYSIDPNLEMDTPYIKLRVNGYTSNLTMAKGDKLAIFKLALPAGTRTGGITCTSSNTNIVQIVKSKTSDTQYMKAVGKGTATITARANNTSEITGSITVKVASPAQKAKNITVSSINEDTHKGDTIIHSGQKLLLKVATSPAAASKMMTYTSSNPKVATVSSTGRVTGQSGGVAYITVKTKDGSNISKKIRIVVTSFQKINTCSMKQGETVPVSNFFKIRPSERTKRLIVTSSDTSILGVLNGNFIALSPGKVKVTLRDTAAELEKTYTFTVK